MNARTLETVKRETNSLINAVSGEKSLSKISNNGVIASFIVILKRDKIAGI